MAPIIDELLVTQDLTERRRAAARANLAVSRRSVR